MGHKASGHPDRPSEGPLGWQPSRGVGRPWLPCGDHPSAHLTLETGWTPTVAQNRMQTAYESESGAETPATEHRTGLGPPTLGAGSGSVVDTIGSIDAGGRTRAARSSGDRRMPSGDERPRSRGRSHLPDGSAPPPALGSSAFPSPLRVGVGVGSFGVYQSRTSASFARADARCPGPALWSGSPTLPAPRCGSRKRTSRVRSTPRSQSRRSGRSRSGLLPRMRSTPATRTPPTATTASGCSANRTQAARSTASDTPTRSGRRSSSRGSRALLLP